MFASPSVVLAARVGQPNLGRPPILFQGFLPSSVFTSTVIEMSVPL